MSSGWIHLIMPLILLDDGLTSIANVVRVNWTPGLQIGLFAADIYPDQSTSVVSLQPASFSGYPGLLVLGAWFGPQLVGTRAVLTTSPVLFVHDGGPRGERIFGFYLLSASGQLVAAERFEDAPKDMVFPGQVIVVTPTLSIRSQYLQGVCMATLYGTQSLDVDIGAGAINHVATAGPLDLALIDLVQINGPFGRNADYAALLAAVATFAGYAQGTITWAAPSLDDQGAVEVIGTTPAFRATGSTPANQIYGVLIQNAGGTKMYFNGPVDNGPVDFSSALDQLIVTLRWKPATSALSISVG